jgi:hypothetical protein
MHQPGSDGGIKNSFRDATLRPALDKFFNEELDASRAFLAAHVGSTPEDPLAYALAAALDFYGSMAAWILSGPADRIGRLVRGQRMELSVEQRDRIMDSIRRAEGAAERTLADGACADLGIFALALVSGVCRDYHGVVLNQWKESLGHAQEANLLGRKLLKANPKAHDAYCIFAWSEYLIARLPSVARPFAKIPGITGNRTKAIQFCEVASRTGCYFREAAACLLVALYTEEGRPEDAMRILSGLAGRFPRNSLIAAELKKRQTAARA